MAKNKLGSPTVFDIDITGSTPDKIEEEASALLGLNSDDVNDEDENNPSNESNEEDSNADDSDEDVNQNEDGEDGEATSDEQDEEDDASQSQDGEDEQKKYGDRANKRIRELNARTKAAEQRAAQVAAEIEKERKERYEIERDRVKSQKELLELKTERLKRDWIAASQDGDYEKQAELSSELSKLGTQLAAVESLEKQYSGEYKPQQTQTTQGQPDFDVQKAQELAQEWEFENPRVIGDPAYAATASKIAQGLLTRGIKPDTEEFYSELSERMGKAFGEQGIQKPKSQQSTEKKPGVVIKKKPTPQTVSGGSRTPAPGQASAGGGSVKLTSAEIQEAKNLGQDLKTYASNKAKIEKSIKEKGRVVMDLFD